MLLLLAAPCFANGPKFVGSETDPIVKQEFDNAYQDILNPVINYATISSMTVSFSSMTTARISSASISGLWVSSITANYGLISSATITNLTYATLTPAVAASKILQVVASSTTTGGSTTSATYQEVGTSLRFPSFASTSSRVILLASSQIRKTTGAGTGNFAIFRGATNLCATNGCGEIQLNLTGTSGRFTTAMVAWDSPNTVSESTYSVKINSNDTSNIEWNESAGSANMIGLEYTP